MFIRKWAKLGIFDFLQTIAALALIIGIIVGIVTLRVSRNQQRFQIVEKFSEQWNSPRFMKIQKEFSSEPASIDNFTGGKVVLCNFFDRLGMYESEKIIKIEDVYKMFGNWPCVYWKLLEKAIDEYRTKYDRPRSWANFETLCKAIREFEKRKKGR